MLLFTSKLHILGPGRLKKDELACLVVDVLKRCKLPPTGADASASPTIFMDGPIGVGSKGSMVEENASIGLLVDRDNTDTSTMGGDATQFSSKIFSKSTDSCIMHSAALNIFTSGLTPT